MALAARQAAAPDRLLTAVLAIRLAGVATLQRWWRPLQRAPRPARLQPPAAAADPGLQAWFDALPMPLACTDAHQRYSQANLAYLQWLGRARNEVLGQTVAAVHTPAAAAVLQLGIQRALAGETCRLPVPTGGPATDPAPPGRLQLRFQPQCDANGQAAGVMLCGSEAPDPTDRGAALTQSNQELMRYAHVVSHDLREPLRMVSSFGQLLVQRHHASLAPEAQEFLQFMVDGSQRAQLLIHDLLRLARLDGQPGLRQPVALDTMLAEVLHEMAPALRACAASVTHDALPTLLADPLQMRQLLGNLLGNALKFRGPAALRIHVGAVREPGQWRIRVTDNGIGIDPTAHRRIFGMFQRLHSRSAYEGTGIGLAICERVVQRRSGQIGVDSSPGQGASFHFTVPDATGHSGDAAP
jgi:signal transduction histidine kinase